MSKLVVLAVGVAPVCRYLPATEQHHWRRCCRKYSACGRAVHFVHDDWIRERYTHEHPGWDKRHAPAPHDAGRRDDRRDP